uniref:Elongation factor 2 kinase n=1 Tax=Tetraselmis sp. GSL018 TaxID=582737 RepID=A0A061SBJ0_9CHLO|mmetsp:Transcript_17019/g.40602  ORF Transcript_17019/g.40602 Transcript_17019/m.40602 type:complete len:283 (+) Transcript_17019:246-1094(+)
MAPFSGVKFSYEVSSEQWRTSNVQLDISDAPCGEGGMRYAFHAAELDNRVHSIASVVKVYKDMSRKAAARACFDESMTQMIADSYAQDFNRIAGRHKVAFLPVQVVELQRPFFGAKHVCLEPHMPGHFVKHSDNSGSVTTGADLPQAFSHYTYEASNRLLVVCDIQGQGVDFFTDPQIHSFDGEGFGLGNLGPRGIRRWRQTHRCNAICKLAKLPPLQDGERRQSRPRETDKQLAERLQAEEYAQAGGHAKPPDAQMVMRRLLWDGRRYNDTISNAIRHLAL